MEKLEDLCQSPGHQHWRRSSKRRASQGKGTRDSEIISGPLREGWEGTLQDEKTVVSGGKSSCDGGGAGDRRQAVS